MQAISSPTSPARAAQTPPSAPARGGNGTAGASAFADLLRAAAGEVDGGVPSAAPAGDERPQSARGAQVTEEGNDPAPSTVPAEAAESTDAPPSDPSAATAAPPSAAPAAASPSAASAAPAERGHGGHPARPNIPAARAATAQRAEPASAKSADAAARSSTAEAAGSGREDEAAPASVVAAGADASGALPPVTPDATAVAVPVPPPETEPGAEPQAARGVGRGGQAPLSARGASFAPAGARARSSADAQTGPAADASRAPGTASRAEAPGLQAAAQPAPPSPVDAGSAAAAAQSAAAPPADALVASMAAVPAGAAPATPAAESAGASTPPAPAWHDAQVGAALGSSAFAPALGTTLAVLARDGVQQARLQLNPAELGPVAVRITLDGNSAQVDFHAAAAATREALEAALPALAVAMHETGLTLTGGGVHEQSSQARDSSDSAWNRMAGGGAGDDRTVDPAGANPPVVRVRRGLVDLVA